MNQILYEQQQDGVIWSLIVTGFLVGAIVIGYIWSKIGQGRKK